MESTLDNDTTVFFSIVLYMNYDDVMIIMIATIFLYLLLFSSRRGASNQRYEAMLTQNPFL